MGAHTEHNWRPLPEQVRVGGGAFITMYTRRCTRCGTVMSRPGWQGAVWVDGIFPIPARYIDNQGNVIARQCKGK